MDTSMQRFWKATQRCNQNNEKGLLQNRCKILQEGDEEKEDCKEMGN